MTNEYKDCILQVINNTNNRNTNKNRSKCNDYVLKVLPDSPAMSCNASPEGNAYILKVADEDHSKYEMSQPRQYYKYNLR